MSAFAFFWGVAEGSVFFLLPDTLLTATALGSFRKALRQCLWALVGALVAGFFLHAHARRDPTAARNLVLKVPFVRPTMIDAVDAVYARRGAAAVLMGPLRGIPYKIYAVRAPVQGIGLGAFLLVSVPARLARFVAMAALAAGVSRLLGSSRRRAAWALWAGLWAVGYGLYWAGVAS